MEEDQAIMWKVAKALRTDKMIYPDIHSERGIANDNKSKAQAIADNFISMTLSSISSGTCSIINV